MHIKTKARRMDIPLGIILATKNTLNKKDFLDGRSDEQRLRRNIIISVTGPKCSGKTTAADKLNQLLIEAGYAAITSRASKDSLEVYKCCRENLVNQQEQYKEIKWYDVVNAIRAESASALERKVIPSLKEDEHKIAILTRYCLPDTLVKQTLLGAPIQAVAQYLRGIKTLKEEPQSGYIKPNIVLVFFCNGAEARNRLILRHKKEMRGEVTQSIDEYFSQKIDEEIDAYKKLSGYNETLFDNTIPFITKSTKKLQAYPGEIYFINTATNLDYINTSTEDITRELEKREREIASAIYKNIIIPRIESIRIKR